MNKRLLYAQAVYGQEEKDAVMQSLENSWLVGGKLVTEFEKNISKLFGKKYGVAVNSGSSANLLALTALGIAKGSEVITPACTFATTVAPIVQCGLVPVFVDSVIGRYTIDEAQVEEAITEKTKVLMIPQLIGGVTDMVKLRKLAYKYDLAIIDDSCDTLAPKYDESQLLADFSDITTTSFYGSHIITAMGAGGMVMTNDEAIALKLRSLINWGRVGSDNENFAERFNFTLEDIPYDAKFIYEYFGYNMKMTEAQAAFGLMQLQRLEDFQRIRAHNFAHLYSYFKEYEKWFYLPQLIQHAETTWLAFPLTIKAHAPFSRYQFLDYLDKQNVQVRVLFSGNITRHPIFKEYRRAKAFPNADEIMKSGFLLGLHQGLSETDIIDLTSICERFLCQQ